MLLSEIKKIIVRKCVQEGKFTSSSGLELDWMCDLLQVQPLFSDMMSYFEPKYSLAGIHTGGWLLVSSGRKDLCGTMMIRGAQIYNYSITGNPVKFVSLFDDVCTTGQSYFRAEEELRKKNIRTKERFCILDRRSAELRKSLPVRSLFLAKDLGYE